MGRSSKTFFLKLNYIILILICKNKQTTNLTTPCTIQVTYETPVVIDHAVQNLELGHVLLQRRLLLLCSDSAFVRAILEDMRAMQ